jgi:hypothetical protein
MFKSLARTAVNTAFRSSAARPAMAKSLPRALPHAMPSFRFMSTDDSEAQRPTMAEVQLLPRHVSEYSSELLISAALHGDSDAIRERLTREVMRVDSLEWDDATNKIAEIENTNQSGLALIKLPYMIGITAGFVSAWGCLPFVFDLTTAEWFNTHYVTTEHPPPEDVETWLEVGGWTWNWMEPLLGTVSFMLLALQFMRNQMLNVGFKPYTGWLVASRADKLANAYPQYGREMVRDFAISDMNLGSTD